MISVNPQTRWLHDTPGNILDLCLVDNTEIIKDIDITRLGNSDHLCLEIELIFPFSKDTMHNKFSKFLCFASLCAHLCAMNMEQFT